MIPNKGVPISESTGVPGWHQHQDEEQVLIDYAEMFVPDGGLVVELGTEYSRSACEMAYGCRNKTGVTVISIDLFPTNHGLVGDLWAAWAHNVREASHLFPGVSVKQIRANSYEYGFAQHERRTLAPVDLLFIDAAHDFKSVTKDLEAWSPLMADSGAIIMHDYWKNEQSHPLHREVKRAVDAWRAGKENMWEFHDLPGSMVSFTRVKQPDFVTIVDHNTQIPAANVRLQPTTQVITSQDIETMQTPSKAYTIQEIADIRGVSVSTVRNWTRGLEPAGKEGRALTYYLEDLPQ